MFEKFGAISAGDAPPAKPDIAIEIQSRKLKAVEIANKLGHLVF